MVAGMAAVVAVALGACGASAGIPARSIPDAHGHARHHSEAAVIVGASPPRVWDRISPLLETAISTLRT
jgi:hypothetical protein